MKVLKKPATKLTGEIRKSITSKLMFSYTRWQRKLKKTSLLEYVEFFCREKLYICSIILYLKGNFNFLLTWNVARGSKESLYPSKDGSSSSGRSLASTRSSVLAVLTIFLKLSSWSNGDRNDEDEVTICFGKGCVIIKRKLSVELKGRSAFPATSFT